MNRHISIIAALAIAASPAFGRNIEEYIDWGPMSHNFPAALSAWTPGSPLTPDDNFFISRVRPAARFSNPATQVHGEITPDMDKNLIYWVPCGTPPHNALPSDRFDSDVFSMWSYVTHFGNWSTQMARIPGNFSDAAHRNGVGVSPVLSTPWGQLTAEWGITLRDMLAVGAEKMADFLAYYGIDGLGYNSEFTLNNGIPESEKPGSVSEISDFNATLTRIAAQKGNPAYMNIWYDGTATNGNIMFDRGLGEHNFDTFGRAGNEAAHLFFNYNWNRPTLIESTIENARSIGRNPLEIYAAFNMQGGEPSKKSVSWSLLKDYPLSIGLWGAHSESMMYESRRELNSSREAIQRNYLLRTEWWFTGGTRNPASSPEISDMWNYSGENTGFFGMSRLMTARSALTEPFVTSFNLGNGTFFNYKGQRRSESEWANIGMQDILPTWRFWWSKSLLGGEASDVPATGLDASFTWDDAWLGGSSLRISGTKHSYEYLHLFKTSIELKADDRFLVRYKQLGGHANMRLILSAEGSEKEAVVSPTIMQTGHYASQDWREVTFALSELAPELSGKKLALVALRFDSADDIDLLLGGFGILRDDKPAPATPLISRTELLYAGAEGADGKIVWEMPQGETLRYNEEQNVSFFQLYAQQEGCEPILQSGTSSWAGLLLATPIDHDSPARMRLGVAAVSADFSKESDIAWGEWHDMAGIYQPSHLVKCSESEVRIGTPVTFSFADSRHAAASWTITRTDEAAPAARLNGTQATFTPDKAGQYSLAVTYTDPEDKDCTDTYPGILAVVPEECASAPRILDFVQEEAPDNTLSFSYKAHPGEGKRSQGLQIDGCTFGTKPNDYGINGRDSFSFAFWLCPDRYDNEETHLVSIRDKAESWSKNEWGYLWSTIGKDGHGVTVTIRRNGEENMEIHFPDVYLPAGVWNHVGFSFDFAALRYLDFGLFINGERVPASYYVQGEERTEGVPESFNKQYTWRKTNMMSIGGTLFKTGGIEGVIDNVTVWNAPLTEGRARLAASDIDPTAAPEGLTALYSFENAAGQDHYFVNEIKTSSYPDAVASAFRYVPQVTEGSGIMQNVAPAFCGGAPSLAGGRHMSTSVTWIAPGAAEITPQGDATAGSVKLTYPDAGVYKVVLRLENAAGSDQREFNMVRVNGTTSIETPTAEKPLSMNRVMMTAGGVLVVSFDNPGIYDVRVTSLDGRELRRLKATAGPGNPLTLSDLPGSTPLIVSVY